MTNIRNIVSSVSLVIKHLTSKKFLEILDKGKENTQVLFFSLFLRKKCIVNELSYFPFMYIYTRIFTKLSTVF